MLAILLLLMTSIRKKPISLPILSRKHQLSQDTHHRYPSHLKTDHGTMHDFRQQLRHMHSSNEQGGSLLGHHSWENEKLNPFEKGHKKIGLVSHVMADTHASLAAYAPNLATITSRHGDSEMH